MKVFLLEYITGGGLWSEGSTALDSTLLAEGRAMIRAVAADFAALGRVDVVTTRDSRLPPLHPAGCTVTEIGSREAERRTIERLAAEADWTLLIAPELRGALVDRCHWVQQAGGRLLSPGLETVVLASDKQKTVEHLRRRGVFTPRGVLAIPGFSAVQVDVPLPWVLKPLDGCGSIGVMRIDTEADMRLHPIRDPARLEELVPGLAVSVSVLCGPAGHVALPACEQRLTSDGRFTYLGGRLPLPPMLDARARRLALAAVNTLPSPLGYLGVDLVLGEASDGSGDRVIEINPRLTTSYVGLRALSKSNLAAAMLAVAQGHDPDLRWHSHAIEFTADGTLSKLPATIADELAGS